MYQLPDHENLDIASLSQCFRHVANSYKFYWFLAILDHIAVSEELTLSYDDLALSMLAQVWYPLDYYKLSFGKQDSFILLARQIAEETFIDNQLQAPPLLQQIEEKLPIKTVKRLKKDIRKALMRWVSYRF